MNQGLAFLVALYASGILLACATAATSPKHERSEKVIFFGGLAVFWPVVAARVLIALATVLAVLLPLVAFWGVAWVTRIVSVRIVGKETRRVR